MTSNFTAHPFADDHGVDPVLGLGQSKRIIADIIAKYIEDSSTSMNLSGRE